MNLSNPVFDLHTPDDDAPETVRSMRFGRARILIADDDVEMRTVVADTLEADGYRVRVASSGGAFLDAVAAMDEGQDAMDGVDLVVIDNRMPGISGLEALRRLRQTDRKTPAILMTAYPAPQVEAEALGMDATVLSKPFTGADLRRTVVEKLVSRASIPW